VARRAWLAAARIADLGARELARARRQLGPLDRRRFARFRSPKRRREFLAGRALLQRMGLRFDSSPEGGIRAQGRFGASVSHARGWVACVVVSSGRPGIDIEPMIDRDFDKLGQWAFGSGGTRNEFYGRWTRHEARIKAFGEGTTRRSHIERTWFLGDAAALSVCLPARTRIAGTNGGSRKATTGRRALRQRRSIPRRILPTPRSCNKT
jgi:4'-phosphopantetheinyl transferase